MQSEIKVGQRFKFSLLSDNSSQERQAVVTRVLSNREEGLGSEVEFYFAYWVEAHELPETEAPTTLVFQRGKVCPDFCVNHLVLFLGMGSVEGVEFPFPSSSL